MFEKIEIDEEQAMRLFRIVEKLGDHGHFMQIWLSEYPKPAVHCSKVLGELLNIEAQFDNLVAFLQTLKNGVFSALMDVWDD